ncbi:MAG: hypothetical protein JRN59_07755 [Nitrososphaerota archaeon]|nr:hypothetical protein [Nitrososphaerota archaeon]
MYDVVVSDPAIERYLQDIEQRKGKLSKGVYTHIRTVHYRFLAFLGIEPSNHAYSDIIQKKKVTPSDPTLEITLKRFFDSLQGKRSETSYLMRMFETNGLELRPQVYDPATWSLHVWRPRKHRQMHPYNETVSKDPALTRYFNAIRNKRRNQGYISKVSMQETYQASTKFLLFLGNEITDHAISDLVKRKQQNPQDFWIEDKLLEFANTEPLTSFRRYAVRMLGVFRENRARLQATIDYHFTTRTKKISEGILREIFLAQDFEKRTLMEYQVFAGERIQCLSKLDISQIEPFNDKYSIIRVKFNQNKARIPHSCIIPNRVAESIRIICNTTKRSQPFPNYETLWKQITRHASQAFGVRLTSHYLRKRFHTIAGKTAMPVNSWDYLMGDKQSWGHGAETYTLEDFGELIQEYDRHLARLLPISPEETERIGEPFGKERALAEVMKENTKLKERLLNLTKMLEESL